MSWEIETRNYGRVTEFGFWGIDTTRIMLGDLPGMPTAQFCAYATDVIVSASDYATLIQVEKMRHYVKYALDKNQDKRVRPTDNPLAFPKQRLIEFTSRQQITDRLDLGGINAPRSFFEELNQVMSGDDQEKKDQFIEEYHLARNLSQGNTEVYSENPFRFEDGNIVMGETYVVDLAEFTRFAVEYMGGGMRKWDSRGIPDYAYGSLQALKQAVEI